MVSAKSLRRLVVTADDFGASTSVNHAVIQAHQKGILTTASLMVNGQAANEAVELAKANPRLGVGLHLTLCRGRTTLSPSQIPVIAQADGRFFNSPLRAGLKYFFSGAARRELELEVEAQLNKFRKTQLHLDHVNGHLHFHLHPKVLPIVLKLSSNHRIRGIRVTFDPVTIDWPLGYGRWFYRLSHWAIFHLLSLRADKPIREHHIARTNYVFGLLENGRVNENYIVKLLKILPSGDSELYSHPSLHEFKREYEALVSPRVMEVIREENIKLVRYQDLCSN